MKFCLHSYNSFHFDEIFLRITEFEFQHKIRIFKKNRQIEGNLEFLGYFHEFFAFGDNLHFFFAEVNEEGTEAAAATGILMKSASIRDPQKKIDINRPFLFFIKDHQTGLNLFSGRVLYPEYY